VREWKWLLVNGFDCKSLVFTATVVLNSYQVGTSAYKVCPKNNEIDFKIFFIEHACSCSLSPSK
jgi:hypothetical protein